MTTLRISLEIPAERYLAIYAGSARSVLATAQGGINVQFPASALREFVTHAGVYGVFDVHFDNRNRLTSVSRVKSSADTSH